MPVSPPLRKRMRAVRAYRFILCAGLLVFAGALALPTSVIFQPSLASSSVDKRKAAEFVPGEILVRYRSGATASSEERRANSITSAEGREIPVNVERFAGSDLIEGLRRVRVTPDQTLKAIEALRARQDVVYAEPNYIRHPDATPDDPKYLDGTLYGLTKIQADRAWDTTTGSRSVVVGVVDEGLDVNHPDLRANIWVNPGEVAGNGLDDDGNGFVDDVNGYDFVNDTGAVLPGAASDSHGTHVAGIVGAVGNNSTGVVGVNWQVSLMSLKIFDSANSNLRSGSDAVIIAAYGYAKKMRDLWVSSGGVKGANIRVLNNSYGGGLPSQASLDAINALDSSGILFVAGAGNNSFSDDVSPHYPASYGAPNILAVAATDQNDNLASFSNFGAQTIHLGAPGVGIYSTFPGGGYGFLSGTSMATPHVAGAAALICARYPNITLQQLRSVLLYNGDAVPALADKTLSGYRLNVFKSLQVAGKNDLTPPGAAGGFRVLSQSGRAVELAWTDSGDDGDQGQASIYELDFTDPSTGAPSVLKRLHPGLPGSAESLTVSLPFQHLAGTVSLREFDHAGNEGVPATTQVSVPPSAANPYSRSLGLPGALSTGGTAQGLTFDDRYKPYTLPFAFPFFGQAQNSVIISTNGALYFSNPPVRSNGDADDAVSSVNALGFQRMIAGLWDDLTLETRFRADADVYIVTPDANRVIFRWQGTPCNADPVTNVCTGGDGVNFEVELRTDGTIFTRYGAGNTGVTPVVGISGGEPEPFLITSLTSKTSKENLTGAPTITYSPAGNGPPPAPTVQFGAASFSVGEGDGQALVMVTRLGDISGTVTVDYSTSDGSAIQRTKYTTASGTLTFAPGEASKTFPVLITDEAFVEGDQTVNLTLSNPAFSTLGSPSTAVLTIVDNDTSPGSSNPDDDPGFFVRQQYLDFLNREPDAAGLQYWTGTISACGADAQCIRDRRVGVADAFFFEPEFQDTGGYVYRVYKAAFGVRPAYAQFLPDRSRVVGGASLDQSKTAFTTAFVQRSAFTSTYLPGLGRDGFVDAMLKSIKDNTSVDLISIRNDLISAYDSGGSQAQSRGLVVRKVAETQAFIDGQYNESFVVTEYFGYLRRDPDDAGFAFWLGQVNKFPLRNVDIQHAMACSFITSTEYQTRFAAMVNHTNRECPQ